MHAARPCSAFAAALVAVLMASSPAFSQPVTTASLLREMTDLKSLAQYPQPAFTCRQFSSYDRASTSPDDPNTWFANADAGHFLRTEERDGRTEYVMMDADGPGAIVRLWSANPGGTLRIYLDGAASPTFEAPMADLLAGKAEGIPPPIAAVASMGWNCYFPLPYASHCRVTSDKGDFYYHVNYRTYARGTLVETFKPELLTTLADEIAAAATRLRCEDPGLPAGTKRIEVDAIAEKATTLVELDGPGAITRFDLRVKSDDVVAALRRLVLEMQFDGDTTVAAPVGDFFGAAPGVNAYRSLPLSVSADGWMSCRWYMPYQKNARIIIRNTSKRPGRVEAVVVASADPWTDRTLHFHAKWRGDRQRPTRPMIDWNYLNCRGRGVFVGAAFSIANPVKAWWGEGDEKIYVDGETFPSWFGTGTEDYYGYAWCCPKPFEHAYHNQPRCDGPGNYGHTAVNRWHILDRIPFERELRFDMELWHWDGNVKVDMAVVAYWYARPGGEDRFAAIRPDDLDLTLLPKYVVPHVAGAIEGESMEIVDKVGEVDPQGIDACSGEAHLWWHAGMKPGDKLTLKFPVEKAGRYRVLGRFVKADDYGIIQLTLNGQQAGEPLDFYNDKIVVSPEIDLGTFDLPAGDARLVAEIVGANASAKPAFMFGLDYIRLEATP